MGKVAIERLAARANHIRLFFAMSRTIFRFIFACPASQVPLMHTISPCSLGATIPALYWLLADPPPLEKAH
jgi:hypothetical protein